MNTTPYSHIGEASRESAILTNAEGYDVAVIERATVRAPGLPQEHHMTDDQWQSIINLVDVAPDLLEFARSIKAWLTSPDTSKETLEHFYHHAATLVKRADEN